MPPLEPIEGSLAYSPLLLNEKEARGSYKKPGELLTALLLRAEAKEPFLQPRRDLTTKAHAQRGLSKQTLTREGRTKSQENSRRPSRSVQRLGGSSCNLAETQRPRLAHKGLGKQPLLPNEKDARGSYKKPGELLTALLLRAEARELFL